jgi:hypothetical protein
MFSSPLGHSLGQWILGCLVPWAALVTSLSHVRAVVAPHLTNTAVGRLFSFSFAFLRYYSNLFMCLIIIYVFCLCQMLC